MLRHFTKHYLASCRELSPTLSDREAAALWRLSLWIKMHDNVIRGPNGAPMTQRGIAVVLCKGPRQTKEILAELEARGLLQHLGRGKGYALNPALVGRGAALYIESKRLRTRKLRQ